MKFFNSLPASTRMQPAGFRQVRLLLLSLLTFGLLLSLPSLDAATPQFAESGRADRPLASAPFIIGANDLWRVIRSDYDNRTDDSGEQPVLPWSACNTFASELPGAAVHVAAIPGSLPRPVSTLPGAPRGPPALPL